MTYGNVNAIRTRGVLWRELQYRSTECKTACGIRCSDLLRWLAVPRWGRGWAWELLNSRTSNGSVVEEVSKMDERQIGLALTLNELGMRCDVSGFDSRLILQKTVYLIEEAGIRLGYSFNWHLRGPYSPALTRDLFDLASNSEDVTDWVLDDHSKSIAQRVRPLFSAASNEDLAAKACRLELAASLLYLLRRQRVSVDDCEKAKAQLAKNGKHFSSDEVSAAVQLLRQVKLF